MRSGYPKVSIITVNFNGKKYLKKLFDSVFCLNYPKEKLEIILVDNVSTDNSIEFVKKNYRKVKIIKNEVNNYCKALNLGIETAKAGYVAFINNDMHLDKNWLTELVKVITKEKNIACVGSKVLTMKGKIQNVGHYELPNFYWGERGAGKKRKLYDTLEEVPSLCGAAVLYRKEVFSEIGFFDEDFIMFGEDTDMAFRLRQKGYKLIFVPTSIANHKFHGTASEEFNRYYIERNRLLFLAKHYPHKLSSSLLGSGYFTAKSSIDSSGRLYSLISEIILKLVKTHHFEVVKEALSELFEEVKRISNLENDILIKKFNEMAGDQKKACVELSQRNKEFSEKLREIEDKDFFINELNKKNTQLRQDIETHLGVIQKKESLSQEKENILREKEKELTAYKDELNNLTTHLRSRMDEVLLKSGELIEKDVEMDKLRQEIQTHLSVIQKKESLSQEKEKELTAYKDELNNLTTHLRSRMDEVLLKSGELIEKKIEIDALRKELSSLADQIANSLVTNEEAKIELLEKEKELTAYKNELENLSTQLHSRMDQVLIKDGQLIEKDVWISQLQHEIQAYLNTLQEKNTQISKFKHEIQAQLNILQEKEGLILSKDNEINNLKKELSGIYNSEGFRFVLSPLWKSLWNMRAFLKAIARKLTQAFWFIITIALVPVFLFLSLSFLFEHIAWVILSPLLKRTTPKRKIISAKNSRISLVIPNYNGTAYLKECLPSVFLAEGFVDGQNEVLVVDDGSSDGSVDFIRNNFPGVRLIQNNKNRGFGFTCNRGVKAARNEIIVLINNDIILTKDFLDPLLAHLRKGEDVFAVTPKLYAWDRKTFVWGMHMGHFEKGHIKLWNEAETGNGDKINQASPSIFAIGGAMVFRKEDFLWLGGFDEIYRPNCWEDIDISYRGWKRGLKVIYEPQSLMYHKGRATLTYERPKEVKNELLFTWKNITDPRILKNHLNLLPWNIYRNRLVFLKGFLWALNYIPQTLLHRILERRFIINPEDRKIFNKITLYYKNFVKRGFSDLGMKKPNVLIVSRFLPYPLNAGGKIRIHTLTKLVSHKYNFILLSLIDHENELRHIPKLKEVFTEVYPVLAKSPLNLNFATELLYPELYKHAYSYSQELVDKLKEIQNTTPLDAVHIESNELLYLVDHVEHVPVVYTEHDISILSFGKSYYKNNGHFIVSSFFDHLKRIYFHNTQFKKLDKVITLSKEDECVLKKFFPEADITLIPTGVDLEHFSFRNKPQKSKKLIFVGHYLHYPNEDAVAYFVRNIFRLIRKKVPEAELLIVGSGSTPNIKNLAQKRNVVLIGEVNDVKPYLEHSAVFVNSLRISAGIKGKVLEAMSSGVPVVSTKVGSSGIDALPGKEILIADSPKEFAKQVIRLLKDDELNEKLITNARRLVENKYGWLENVDKLDRLYKDLLFDSGYENQKFSAANKIIDRIKNFVESKIERLNGDLSNPEEGPDELHIELTYNCNSKCIMCDLWDHNRRVSPSGNSELSSDEIKHFIEESRLLQKAGTVVLSGGEPFLRNDIVNLCGFFAKQLPNSSIGILTNGIDTETILSKTKEVFDKFQPRSLWLGSSLDGIGKRHDKIRGTEGAFLAFSDTVSRCKKELPQVKLSATFTLTPYNIDQLIPAKQFADNEGLDFFAQFVVPKEAREEFVWTPQNLDLAEKEIMQIIQEIISKTDQQDLLGPADKIKDKNLISQLYYWSHLLKYQTNPQRFFKKCISGSKFAMFNPYGELFFCPNHKRSCIGNIRKERFDNLWLSERAHHMRSFIKNGNCHCWLVCIVFPILEKALNKR